MSRLRRIADNVELALLWPTGFCVAYLRSEQIEEWRAGGVEDAEASH